MVCTLYIEFYKFKIKLLDITVNFEQMIYNVDEDSGPVQPVLVLSNPSSISVIIEVLSTDGSAAGKYAYFLLCFIS